MNKNTKWKYILLGVVAFLVVIVFAYISVASYFHVPVVSLLPSGSRPLYIPVASPTPTEEPAPPPVQRFTTADSAAVYIITGKFVTAPAYNAQHLLQSDFVIDKDPAHHSIAVVMTTKDGKMSVGTSQRGFNGKTSVASQTGEDLRKNIHVNTVVQLRIYAIGATRSQDYIVEQKVMDDILAGNWSIPDGFVLHPQMINMLVWSK